MEQLELLPDLPVPDRKLELVNAQRSWATLQPILMSLDDLATLEWMMRYEQVTKNRIRILDRIYSRWNKLRQEADRRNLSKGILPF